MDNEDLNTLLKKATRVVQENITACELDEASVSWSSDGVGVRWTSKKLMDELLTEYNAINDNYKLMMEKIRKVKIPNSSSFEKDIKDIIEEIIWKRYWHFAETFDAVALACQEDGYSFDKIPKHSRIIGVPSKFANNGWRLSRPSPEELEVIRKLGVRIDAYLDANLVKDDVNSKLFKGHLIKSGLYGQAREICFALECLVRRKDRESLRLVRRNMREFFTGFEKASKYSEMKIFIDVPAEEIPVGRYGFDIFVGTSEQLTFK